MIIKDEDNQKIFTLMEIKQSEGQCVKLIRLNVTTSSTGLVQMISSKPTKKLLNHTHVGSVAPYRVKL